MSEPDSDFLGGGHLHDLNHLGKHLARIAHQTDTTFFRMPGAAPEAERSERGEPDHFEVRILKGNANRLGIHPQASPSPAVDLHAMREFALLDAVIDVTLRGEG